MGSSSLPGGTPAGVIVLDAVVFVAGVAILGAAIAWFARRIFRNE